MSDRDREKFLKHLRKQMKHGQSAGERVSAQKLYAQMMNGTNSYPSDIGIVDGKAVELQSTLPAEPDLSDYAQEARRAVSQPRSELSSILGLIRPERWMSGNWCHADGGWSDAKDHYKLLTFNEARVLIAARISELGLNPERVFAHSKSRCTIAEDFALWNMSFEEQMERFRPEVLR
jgi:hypothetical protein